MSLYLQNVKIDIFSPSYQPFYACDEWIPFVKTCIEKMEAMDPLKLSSTLNAFVQRFETD